MLVGTVALYAKTSGLAASGGEASVLSVLVHGTDDPVDAGIVADGDVVGVDEDDLEVLVGGILVHPVAVQHTQVAGVLASLVLSDGTQVASELQVINTLVHGLTVHHTNVVGTLATTSADGDAEDAVSLLGLVSQLVCLVGTSGAADANALLSLAVLPSSVR